MPTNNNKIEKVRVYIDDYIQSKERTSCPTCGKQSLAVMANAFLRHKFCACVTCGERFVNMIVND